MRPIFLRSVFRVAIIATPILLVLHYFATHVLALIHIFFQHPGIAITQREVANAYLNGTLQESRKAPQIPKIIHQIFHNWKDPANETLPSDWDQQRHTCTEFNPDWEYRLWTHKSSLAFLSTHYPTFLPAYLSYPHPVQRVDALRYFLLYHHGGIYLDLDNGCLPSIKPGSDSLDALTYFPLWITDGGRGALSNNILAARPNHPFWGRVVAELIEGRGALPLGSLTERLAGFWKRWWCLWGVLRYVEISWGVGQWFIGGVWDEYHRMLQLGKKDVVRGDTIEGVVDEEVSGRLYRLMMDSRPGMDEWVFFTQGRGGTWHGWDNWLFLEIGDHLWIFSMVLGSLVGLMGWLARRYWRAQRGKGYRKVKSEDMEDRSE
ncbi:nucleotide-diphospho-sugar transferase [Neurospora intermedia]|uniref:Nucleotide-diphospho-sugar transferase n=1 Tax=Neurospora intermedia TaxID=5142 RepID=A0ABR3D044_NEUIN